MPHRYRILLSKRSAKDLQEIFDYIYRDSPRNAVAVIEHILQSIETLKIFPHRNLVKGQSGRVKNPIRSLPVQSWVIFFRVRDDERVVRIVRIRHGARRRPRGWE